MVFKPVTDFFNELLIACPVSLQIELINSCNSIYQQMSRLA